LMELRVNGELNGLAKDLAQMVDVSDTGINWLRYTVADPYVTNPALLRYVTGLGIDVVTLSPVTRTLEDIYLQVVKEDEASPDGDNR